MQAKIGENQKKDQNPIEDQEEIIIQTTAQCGECKENIEKALMAEKGVKFAELDIKSKKVKVVYNSKKISPEQLRNTISLVGYDADDVLADPEAVKKLNPQDYVVIPESFMLNMEMKSVDDKNEKYQKERIDKRIGEILEQYKDKIDEILEEYKDKKRIYWYKNILILMNGILL